MQKPNKLLSRHAKEMRKHSTLGEVLFWNVVKNKQLDGLDFDRQRVIGPYIVDFYCAKKKLVIEIDGWTHNDKVEYDANRDKYLRSCGLRVLHVDDHDIKFELNSVIELIRYICCTGE